MASKNLSREQRNYLIDKAFKALNVKLKTVVTAELAENKIAREKAINAAWARLRTQHPAPPAVINAGTISFSVKLPKSSKLVSFHGRDYVTRDSCTVNGQYHSIEYLGDKSKKIGQEGIKLIDDFNGKMIMKGTAGVDNLLENLIYQIKALK